MAKILGIDLGTTNSCIAVIEGEEPTVIVNTEGLRTTPSMVAFTTKGERHVGIHAKRQAAVNPERTIYGIKRLIGRRASDESIKELEATLPYRIAPSPTGDAWVKIDSETYSPQEISAIIIRKLRESAESYCSEEIKQCVVAVPAYFNDAQRQATRDACKLAGLNVLRIMNEPTLAALAFGVKKNATGYIGVFDLGGGTFDISILQCSEGTFKVLATAGNNHLGGNDFDTLIYAYLADKFKEETGVDISGDKMAVQRVREAAEQIKCELSSLSETQVNLPFLAIGPSGPLHLSITVTRTELESLVEPLIEQLDAPCLDALDKAGLSADDLEEVLLVGGMTRMPAVRARVERIFGNKASHSVNPDEAVALGAAIQSGILGGDIQEVILLDVTPLNLGLEISGDRVSTIIERNTSIPTRASKVFTTTENNQSFVRITIVQGDSPKASECAKLGTFVLTDIPPMPAGKPRIEVQFSINADGVVNVQGIEKQTGAVKEIVIQDSVGLSSQELATARERI
ncbi:MAG: molecular chaperone DnaK [Proteobacteria bacterium]|nr:molecular chaperone DnaK [Pseudomonadota bacterium]